MGTRALACTGHAVLVRFHCWMAAVQSITNAAWGLTGGLPERAGRCTGAASNCGGHPCRAFPELAGRGELLERVVKQEYDRLKAQYAALAVDNRSQTHLHLACLALATHKALLPFLRDDAHVVELIGEHLGQKSEPGLS